MQLSLLTAAAVVLFWSAPAWADASAEQRCLASHKKTQELELDKKLVDAEEQAVSCSQSACPVEVREMCVDFLRRIRASQPTAVLVVRGTSGKTFPEARVEIDGKPGRARLDGSAVPLDPGSHQVKYEVDGHEGQVTTFILHEGEKDREIALSVDDRGKGPRFSPWAHVFGSIGVASLAAFAAVGTVALVRANALDDDCGRRCSVERPGDVDSVVREAIAADVCLGAGLTFVAAAGLTMGLSWSKAPAAGATATRTTVVVSPRGLGLDVRF